MPIQFNIPRAQTGQSQTFSVNESRVARIANAKTLDEAQRMGLFDRVKDWCRGGVKAEAIRQIYEQVSAPMPHESQPVTMLHRFERMRAMVNPEHQGQFRVSHETGLGAEKDSWGFELTVGDQVLYASGPLENSAENDQVRFGQHLKMYEAVRSAVAYFNKVVTPESRAEMEDANRFIEGRLQFMTDDPQVEAHLRANLDNPLFSNRNFKGFEAGEAGKTFRAVFESKDGHREVLELSDRVPGKNEFRSRILKEAMQSGGEYKNLRELLSQGHLTWDDASVKMALGSCTGAITNALEEIIDLDGNRLATTTPKDQFERLMQLQPKGNPWVKALSEVKIGQVSLADVCFPQSRSDPRLLAQTPKAAELAQNARGLLGGDLTHTIQSLGQLGKNQIDSVLARGRDFALESTQDAIDDPGQRQWLVEHLDDPAFSSENFLGVTPGDDNSTFKANFRSGDGAAVSIVFSNRQATNNEFRSDRLIHELKSGPYGNLREVLSRGQGGATDPIVGSGFAPLVAHLQDQFKADSRMLRPLLIRLGEEGPAEQVSAFFELLRAQSIANTNALEFIMGEHTPPPPLQGTGFLPAGSIVA